MWRLAWGGGNPKSSERGDGRPSWGWSCSPSLDQLNLSFSVTCNKETVHLMRLLLFLFIYLPPHAGKEAIGDEPSRLLGVRLPMDMATENSTRDPIHLRGGRGGESEGRRNPDHIASAAFHAGKEIKPLLFLGHLG